MAIVEQRPSAAGNTRHGGRNSWSSARRIVSWILIVGGVVVVIVSLINGFTSDPQNGEGWGGGVTAAVFAGGPLLAVGIGLRSPDRRIGRWTGAAAVAAAVVVAFVLVMQLLDENETTTNHLITSAALVAFVLAAVTEIPAFTKR